MNELRDYIIPIFIVISGLCGVFGFSFWRRKKEMNEAFVNPAGRLGYTDDDRIAIRSAIIEASPPKVLLPDKPQRLVYETDEDHDLPGEPEDDHAGDQIVKEEVSGSLLFLEALVPGGMQKAINELLYREAADLINEFISCCCELIGLKSQLGKEFNRIVRLKNSLVNVKRRRLEQFISAAEQLGYKVSAAGDEWRQCDLEDFFRIRPEDLRQNQPRVLSWAISTTKKE